MLNSCFCDTTNPDARPLGKTMSKITKADVEYVAGLAQLTLDDATKEKLVDEMGDILAYMEKLN